MQQFRVCPPFLLVFSSLLKSHETLVETSRLLAGPGGDGPKANRRASPASHSELIIWFLVSYLVRRLVTLK
jgi:hypothetical protein